MKDNMRLNAELRKILIENPTLPVVVMMGKIDEEDRNKDYWMYADVVKVKIGEVLDCEDLFGDDEYWIYTDRYEFYDAVREYVERDTEKNHERYNRVEKDWADCVDDMITGIMERYKPFWTKAIVVYADR